MSFLEDEFDPLQDPELTKEQKAYLVELRFQLEDEYNNWCQEIGDEVPETDLLPFSRYLRKIHAGINNDNYMQNRVLKQIQDPSYHPGPLEAIVIEYMFACLGGK